MTDNVRGIVIGDVSTKYVILYGGREQYSWTEKTLLRAEEKAKANKWIEEKKKELGQEEFNRLYPDDKWGLRIY